MNVLVDHKEPVPSACVAVVSRWTDCSPADGSMDALLRSMTSIGLHPLEFQSVTVYECVQKAPRKLSFKKDKKGHKIVLWQETYEPAISEQALCERHQALVAAAEAGAFREENGEAIKHTSDPTKNAQEEPAA